MEILYGDIQENFLIKQLWDISIYPFSIQYSSDGVLAALSSQHIHIYVPYFHHMSMYKVKWISIEKNKEVTISEGNQDFDPVRLTHMNEEICFKSISWINNYSNGSGSNILCVLVSSGDLLLFNIQSSQIKTFRLAKSSDYSLVANGLDSIIVRDIKGAMNFHSIFGVKCYSIETVKDIQHKRRPYLKLITEKDCVISIYSLSKDNEGSVIKECEISILQYVSRFFDDSMCKLNVTSLVTVSLNSELQMFCATSSGKIFRFSLKEDAMSSAEPQLTSILIHDFSLPITRLQICHELLLAVMYNSIGIVYIKNLHVDTKGDLLLDITQQQNAQAIAFHQLHESAITGLEFILPNPLTQSLLANMSRAGPHSPVQNLQSQTSHKYQFLFLTSSINSEIKLCTIHLDSLGLDVVSHYPNLEPESYSNYGLGLDPLGLCFAHMQREEARYENSRDIQLNINYLHSRSSMHWQVMNKLCLECLEAGPDASPTADFMQRLTDSKHNFFSFSSLVSFFASFALSIRGIYCEESIDDQSLPSWASLPIFYLENLSHCRSFFVQSEDSKTVLESVDLSSRDLNVTGKGNSLLPSDIMEESMDEDDDSDVDSDDEEFNKGNSKEPNLEVVTVKKEASVSAKSEDSSKKGRSSKTNSKTLQSSTNIDSIYDSMKKRLGPEDKELLKLSLKRLFLVVCFISQHINNMGNQFEATMGGIWSPKQFIESLHAMLQEPTSLLLSPSASQLCQLTALEHRKELFEVKLNLWKAMCLLSFSTSKVRGLDIKNLNDALLDANKEESASPPSLSLQEMLSSLQTSIFLANCLKLSKTVLMQSRLKLSHPSPLFSCLVRNISQALNVLVSGDKWLPSDSPLRQDVIRCLSLLDPNNADLGVNFSINDQCPICSSDLDFNALSPLGSFCDSCQIIIDRCCFTGLLLIDYTPQETDADASMIYRHSDIRTCPSCDASTDYALLRDFDSSELLIPILKGSSLLCPFCSVLMVAL